MQPTPIVRKRGVAMKHLFLGSALCNVSADGYIAVPATLRVMFNADSNAQLLIARHECETCLIGYDRDDVSRLSEWEYIPNENPIRAAPTSRASDQRLRRIFGLMAELQHGEDRLKLPSLLREMSHIRDRALFVGKGVCFEIWNPDIAGASDDQALRILARRARELVDEGELR